jgi:GntP family gluconate:H+ symporter
MLLIVLIILSIVFIVISTTSFKLHPFLALLVAAFMFGLLAGLPLEKIILAINDGFGSTIGKIGIIIIIGIIIGTFLEKSGGAYTLANLVLKLIGPKNVHGAMSLIGYLVSIPVFSDSGFVILAPLNKAITKKAGLSLAGTAIALSLGLMCTHTMVPPTPGPIAAAGILQADLGLVILLGLGVSLGTLIVTTVYARTVASKVHIDPQPELDEKQIEAKIAEAPSALKSFLPIVLPIILIVLRSVAEFPTRPFGEGEFLTLISFLGNPVTALFIGMLIAFTLPKRLDKEMLSTTGWVGEALKNAALIILITGAGGAFGSILQQSDIAGVLGEMMAGSALGIWLPFLISAAIKSAQGSSTVAIITTASIVLPLLPAIGLDSETGKALAVVSIGAGSNVVSHANDSFFWVMTQMSDMSVKQGYKLLSIGTAIIGFTAMIILSLLNLFL